MSYQTFKIIDGDILVDQDGNLVLTEPNELAQHYKVWLETQFESDFLDPAYGFKLSELFNSNYDNVDELVEFYTIEALIQHPRTKSVDNIIVTKTGQGRYYIQANITIKDSEEGLEVSFSIEQ